MDNKSKMLSKEKQTKPPLQESDAGLDVDLFDTYLPAVPLIDGENPADYEAFHDACLSAIKPKDAIEQIWLRDFIDYSWESLRLRRMKVALIHASRKNAVQQLVYECIGHHKNSVTLAQGWSLSDEESVSAVESLFKSHSLSLENVFAEALSMKLKDLERIDKLISSYDYRRDAAIRGLEKRRDLMAKRAREFVDTVITDVMVDEVKAAE